MADRQYGTKAARREVSLIKVIVPRIEVAIANRAMQVFGAKGLTQDTPLPDIWTHGRYLQIVDGPDEVHLRSIARAEVRASERRKSEARARELGRCTVLRDAPYRALLRMRYIC